MVVLRTFPELGHLRSKLFAVWEQTLWTGGDGDGGGVEAEAEVEVEVEALREVDVVASWRLLTSPFWEILKYEKLLANMYTNHTIMATPRRGVFLGIGNLKNQNNILIILL